MKKYHVNPATGNPGVCNALRKCRFGSDEKHFESPDEARHAYEALMTTGSASVETLASYDFNVAAYLANSPDVASPSLKKFIDETFHDVAPGARVLELGSGGGRDAKYVQNLGHKIQATDGAQGFVDHLKAQGIPAKKLNIITDNIPKSDVIFANATLLHLSRDEFDGALKKIHSALPGRGAFSFTVKAGDGEGWESEKLGAPRHFTYWKTPSLEKHIKAAGFEVQSIEEDGEWLSVRAHKPVGKKNRNVAIQPSGSLGEQAATGSLKKVATFMDEAPRGSRVTLPDGRAFTKREGFSGDAWRYEREGYKFDNLSRLEPGATYHPGFVIPLVSRHGAILSD